MDDKLLDESKWIFDEGDTHIARFAPLEETLKAFARRHNLMIVAYRYGAPEWRFEFAHPAGGCGNITLTNKEDGAISISGGWTACTLHHGIRRLSPRSYLKCDFNPASVEKLLTDTLAWVLTIPESELHDADPSGRSSVGHADAHEYQNWEDSYPQPINLPAAREED